MQTASGLHVGIRPWHEFDLDSQVDLFIRNRASMWPWEPTRPAQFFEPEGQRELRQRARDDWESDRGYAYGVEVAGQGLCGRVSLMNVVRGVAQVADLGYLTDASLWGRGVATAAVGLVLAEAFVSHALHRVQASIMPRNTRSLRVAEKCGFTSVGLSPLHLLINGVWEDHLLYTLTVEQWRQHCAGGGGEVSPGAGGER